MARRLRSRYEVLDTMLPTEAYCKGYGLYWEAPQQSADPVTLSAPDGRRHVWDYIPSLTEVFEKYQEMEANHD